VPGEDIIIAIPVEIGHRIGYRITGPTYGGNLPEELLT
jgi:hypothetical protein